MISREKPLLAALGFVSALCAACDPEPESEPPPPEVAVVEVAEQLTDVVCKLSAECECNFGRQFATNGSAWLGPMLSSPRRSA